MPNDVPDITAASSQPVVQPSGGFTGADLTWPVPAPAAPSEVYKPTPDELQTAEPVTYKPTADELKSAQEVPERVSPLKDFSVDQLVQAAKDNPKDFDPVALFQQAGSTDPAVFDKVADAYHKLRQSGGYTPSLMDMLHNAGKGVVDLAKTGAKLVRIGTAAPFVDMTGEKPDTSTFRGELTAENRREAGEYLAGQKVAGLGLGQMFYKGLNWLGRGLHLTKQLSDYTADDKTAALVNELATRKGMQREMQQGIAPKVAAELASVGKPLRPTEVETSASGSPFAWEAAGKAFGAGTGLVTDALAPGIAELMARSEGTSATPELIAQVQAGLSRLPQKAGDALAAGIGKTLTGVSKAAGKTAETIEPALEPIGKVAGMVGGVAAGHHIAGPAGVALGIAEGFKRGGELGEAASQWAGKVALKFDRLADMGKQIATGEGVKSSVAQAVRDVAQATPSAALHAGAGIGMDAGLMATTTETPQERDNFTPFGTIFGTVSGAKRAGGWALSGHIIAPREWGTAGTPSRPENFAANFPALDAEHNTSLASAPEGIKQRFNAVQKFVDGAAPGTQVVYSPKPKSGEEDPLPAALEQSGIPAAWADQDGFTTKAMGPDGNEHQLIVVRSLDAAPHEARHAMDDVIGAQATQALNDTAKQQFSGDWNAFKQQYADRLTATGLPAQNPDATILSMSGHGDAQAREKIIASVKDALVNEGQDPSDAQVKEAAANRITQAQGEAGQAGQELWQQVLTPEEQARVVDDYVGSEIRAENHDAWFKAGQPGTLRGKMGVAAGNVLSAFGVNPLEGRTSEYGTPLEGSLVEQARQTSPKAAKGKQETPAPAGSPAEHQQRVLDAQKAVQTAPDRTEPGALKSQKEILGVVAEAIARKQGIKLTGLFAPDEPAASLTSDRATRRSLIEIFRSMPDAAKKLWEKNFFPENVPVTGRGNLQVFGWAPEVFAANAHKTAGALNTLADKGQNISPYELDPVTKSFTNQGWQDLYNDVQKYVKNQMAGRTGSGQPLVVPESVTKAGGQAPAVRGEAEPLSQNKADFINHLFNAKLPETGLARQGQLGVPLNVAGQDISKATMPGRVEEPVRERGNFRGAVAKRQGVTGRRILEVNPFRNKLESALKQAGVENPSLIEVNQRLNLKNIKDVQLAPEQPQFRGNTLTLQAGFQPPRTVSEFTDFLDHTQPDDFSRQVKAYQGKYGGGQTGLSFDVGAQVKTPEELGELKTAAEKFHLLSSGALRNKDFQTAIDYASKSQAAREAYEAAAGEGGAQDFIQRYHDPAFTSPMGPKDDARANFQPSRRGNEDIQTVEKQLLKGRPSFSGYESIAPDRAKSIADAYHEAPHEPDNAEVKASYSALKDETVKQWDALTAAGYKMEPWTREGQPYTTSAEMATDLRQNKHLWYFPTNSGFGESLPHIQHPLLDDTGMRVNGEPVLFNDAFRAVHDVFGHAKEGYEFGPRGEYNAYLAHSKMYSPEAHPAMAAETLGQNSWVNFGPHLRDINGSIPGKGEAGYVAPKDRPFAEQKATLIRDANPEEEKLVVDRMNQPSYTAGSFMAQKHKPSDWELKQGSSQFTKAWILPTGELAQFGGTWHHDWLNGQAGLRKKYNIPEAPSAEQADKSRIPAIKAGFARVNYDKYSGKLTIEARRKDWDGMVPSVQELVKNNLTKFDQLAVHLLSDNAKKAVDSDTAQLFDIPKEERVANIPFTEGRQAAPAQVGMAGEEGSQQLFNKAAGEAFGAEKVNFQPGSPMRAIRAAAVKDADTGKLFEAPLHFSAHQQMVEAGYDPHDLFRHPQGFVTNEGEFLDRDQARERAGEMGQLSTSAQIRNEPGLAAEDINSATLGGKARVQFNPPKAEEFKHEATIGTALAKPNWAILTGTQKALGDWDSKENLAANEALKSELVSNGFDPLPIDGKYEGKRDGTSFIVSGMTPEEAHDWGNKFNQESVLVPKGLLYNDDGMHLTDATKTIVGPDATKEPYYSQVAGGPAFSLGLDLSKKIYPTPEEMVLPGIGLPKALSTKDVGGMTKVELANHYPEAVVPKVKDEEISSDIVNSPLAKQGGMPAVVKKLVDFARSVEKSSGYQAGLKWYSDFTPKLKKVFGKHSPMMAELLAATSPNNNPTTNFGFAYDALQGYLSGRFDKQLAKFHEGLEKIENDKWRPWYDKEIKSGSVNNPPETPSAATFLAHWIDKHNLYPRQSNGQLYSMHSVPVLRVFARKWLGQTAGPKTQNFVKNLLGTGHEATIDVWADRTMRRVGYEGFKDRWRILPKNSTGVSDVDFAFSQTAFREAAKQLGVKPDALQGGLWFAEKQLWADKGWGRLDLGDYRKEMAKVPMLEQGIHQRLAMQRAKAKAPKIEQPELLVSAR